VLQPARKININFISAKQRAHRCIRQRCTGSGELANTQNRCRATLPFCHRAFCHRERSEATSRNVPTNNEIAALRS
jgi:hypothetical protein